MKEMETTTTLIGLSKYWSMGMFTLTTFLIASYAINWSDAKEIWKDQYITSASEFDHLLSVCPVLQT